MLFHSLEPQNTCVQYGFGGLSLSEEQQKPNREEEGEEKRGVVRVFAFTHSIKSKHATTTTRVEPQPAFRL